MSLAPRHLEKLEQTQNSLPEFNPRLAILLTTNLEHLGQSGTKPSLGGTGTMGEMNGTGILILRSPVFLAEENFERWLEPQESPQELVELLTNVVPTYFEHKTA